MPLKLKVTELDQVIMSNGVVINVKKLARSGVTLEFDAPPDIKIHTIFNDPAKQFKNIRRRPVSVSEGDYGKASGTQPTPEEQRDDALKRLRRRE